MAQAYNAYHKPYARRIDEDVAVPQAPQPTHAPQPPQQPQPHQTLYPTPRSPPPARTHESRADLYQRPPHHAYQYPDDKYTVPNHHPRAREYRRHEPRDERTSVHHASGGLRRSDAQRRPEGRGRTADRDRTDDERGNERDKTDGHDRIRSDPRGTYDRDDRHRTDDRHDRHRTEARHDRHRIDAHHAGASHHRTDERRRECARHRPGSPPRHKSPPRHQSPPPRHRDRPPLRQPQRRDSNHSDADDELIPDHRLYVETPLHGDAVRLNLRRGFSKVLFPMLAVFSSIAFVVGCGAAAGTTLLLVGRPLFDWVRYGGGGDSGAGDSVFDEPRSLSPLRPLHVARAGAAGGVLACVVPCFLFFMTEVSFSGGPLHARRRRLFERLVRRVWGRGAARSIRNDFARDAQVGRNLNVVIYLVVSLVFAACVGVWAFVLGMEGAGTGAGTGRERTVAATMAEAVAAAMVGWAVLHVGCLGVVGVTVAAKWVPRRVMEGVGWL